MRLKIAFLSKERDDAVRIVEKKLLEHLVKYKNEIDLEVKIFPYDGNPLHSFLQLFHLGNLWQLIKLYKNNDIVHFSSFDNHYIIFNLVLNKIFKSKTVLTVYHLEKDQTNRILDKIGLYKKIFSSFDKYIAISTFTRDQLLKLGISENKIEINRLGVDIDFTYHKELNSKPFKYLLFVGDEYPRKNLETLLKAFFLVKRKFTILKLVKVGMVKKLQNAQSLDKLVDKLKLKNSVVLLRKYISLSELRQYYSNAEIFISPSTLEGFGLPIIEAMRSRCIPLVSDIQPYREFDLPSELYVKKIKNAKVWANKIESLLTMKRARKDRIRNQVYKKSLSYTWQSFAKSLVYTYRQIV